MCSEVSFPRSEEAWAGGVYSLALWPVILVWAEQAPATRALPRGKIAGVGSQLKARPLHRKQEVRHGHGQGACSYSFSKLKRIRDGCKGCTYLCLLYFFSSHRSLLKKTHFQLRDILTGNTKHLLSSTVIVMFYCHFIPPCLGPSAAYQQYGKIFYYCAVFYYFNSISSLANHNICDSGS